jgi:hypothetical protein
VGDFVEQLLDGHEAQQQAPREQQARDDAEQAGCQQRVQHSLEQGCALVRRAFLTGGLVFQDGGGDGVDPLQLLGDCLACGQGVGPGALTGQHDHVDAWTLDGFHQPAHFSHIGVLRQRGLKGGHRVLQARGRSDGRDSGRTHLGRIVFRDGLHQQALDLDHGNARVDGSARLCGVHHLRPRHLVDDLPHC